MRINKTDLVNLLHKKIDGAASKLILDDVARLIFSFMSEKIEEDGFFSIDNFGTFSTYEEPSSLVIDVRTSKRYFSKPKIRVKFRAHGTLRNLIRKRFKKKRSNS